MRPKILKLITSISEKLGEINATYLSKQSPQLRKQNRIKTIHSSLQIEGNTLTEEQITALIENKRVIGPEKDVLEVLNAIKLYENLEKYKFYIFFCCFNLIMFFIISTPSEQIMKKLLIGLGLLSLSTAAFAQGKPQAIAS